MDLSGIGPILTLIGTGGGVWAVIILFRWFQRDFAETYRKELGALRRRLESAEDEKDVERRARQYAEERASSYRFELYRHGISIPADPPREDPPS
jgi:hypothetical protein